MEGSEKIITGIKESVEDALIDIVAIPIAEKIEDGLIKVGDLLNKIA